MRTLKFVATFLLAISLIGCAKQGSSTSSRDPVADTQDEFVFYYPEGYEYDDVFSDFPLADGVTYLGSIAYDGYDDQFSYIGSITVNVSSGYADKTLTQESCQQVAEDETFEGDSVSEVKFSTENGMDVCIFSTTFEGFEGKTRMQEYKTYHKPGADRLYTTNILYDQGMEEKELKALRNAQNKFTIN